MSNVSSHTIIVTCSLTWTEDNHLQTVTDNDWFSYYQYDAGGDRTYKLPYLKTYSNRSGRRSVYWAPEHSTLYASPYLVATPKGYTKHYYAESERVASRTGAGMDSVNLFLSNLADYRESSVSLNSPIWQESWTTEEDFLAKYDTIEWQLDHVVYECLWTYPNVVFDSLNILYSYANLSPYQHENEPDCYWYHPDHLGSSSWITYSDGSAVQHLHYLPWGENFVEQRSTNWHAMYTFSAKEKDAETGYSYFGSRYYSSELSIWLSVDPMSDSIPYMTPYNYCKNSPIVMKDPNGEFPVETIWDIANVVYDVGAAVVNHIKGDHAAAKSNWKNLAFDAAAMFIPYVPAGASKAAGFMLKGFKPLEKCVVGGKTFNKMDDFYKSVVNLSEGEKVLKYKEVGKQVAGKNGWSKNVYLSKKNKRDVYTDKKGNIYSLDTRHCEFEIFDKRGKHQGAVNFSGYKTRDPDSNKHKINL